jgi:hypothetical protein
LCICLCKKGFNVCALKSYNGLVRLIGAHPCIERDQRLFADKWKYLDFRVEAKISGNSVNSPFPNEKIVTFEFVVCTKPQM